MKLVSLAAGVVVALALLTANTHAQTPSAEGTANPELVGALAKELGSTPNQAEGAAGSLFGVAQSKLSPADWAKVSGAVPGMAGLLKAAPATSSGSGAAALAGAAGLGNLAGAASAFSALGLKPELVMKAVPVLVNFVTKSGGANIGSLLAGVLK